jgi:hypothetical protein
MISKENEVKKFTSLNEVKKMSSHIKEIRSVREKNVLHFYLVVVRVNLIEKMAKISRDLRK